MKWLQEYLRNSLLEWVGQAFQLCVTVFHCIVCVGCGFRQHSLLFGHVGFKGPKRLL